MAKRKNSIHNKSSGYIGLFRSLLDWEYADDDAVFSCFVKLLLAVNYKDKKWCGKIIKRGSIVGSIETLCMRLHMKKDKLNRCLKALAECEAITLTVYPNKYHLITVNNYNMYQNIVVGFPANSSDNNPDNNSDNKTDDNSANNTADNPDTTKKYINKKEKKVSAAPQGRADTEKRETAVSGSPLGATASAAIQKDFDYDSVDWTIIQTFPKDTKDVLWGHISYKPICRFARAVGIDDYDADRFYSAFKLSKTILPQDWENVLYRYNQADREKQKEFEDGLMSGEYKEKWNR